MRSLSLLDLIRRYYVVGSVATLVVCIALPSDLRGEPRYWAGEISFVTQASYEEAAPVDTPTASADSHTPRTVNPEPWDARPTQSLLVEPQPLTAEPVAPQASPTPARPPVVSFSGQFNSLAATQMPQRMPVQPAAPQPVAQRTKPFETAASAATISPYLNLFREDADSQVIPNYHAFVRPQLEQREANRRQQQELQQIERQLQSTQTVGGAPTGGIAPGARRLPARFMNTAQFYSGWQR